MNNKVERQRRVAMNLTEQEVSELKAMHRQVKDRRIADRFKAVLLRNKDRTWEEIADDLLLDESTVRK